MVKQRSTKKLTNVQIMACLTILEAICTKIGAASKDISRLLPLNIHTESECGKIRPHKKPMNSQLAYLVRRTEILERIKSYSRLVVSSDLVTK